ncbi:hypothetical protein [uncultured Megasphaera sp.]|uniref:hypothetical protein n=1 Tax=uncultured Megasphaera sp. TaxID=165188 RepID=UPI0028687F04|nr:hypothetical protein [uncultured Megasphaera sp.]
MATKFLDLEGLKYFKNKMDAANDEKYVPQGITINGVAFDGSTNITIHATDSTARIATALIGTANGVAPLGSDGKIPTQYIPGDIGQAVEGYYSGGKFYKEAAHTTEITGAENTLYLDIGGTDKDVYRWTGTAYVLLNDAVSTADKAVRDGDGNTITTTYVKVVSGKGLSTNDYTTAEKNKLAGFYNYTLPAATSSTLGGVKIGSNITVSSGVVSLTSANVTAALGYTPYNAAKVVTYSALSQTEIDTCFA